MFCEGFRVKTKKHSGKVKDKVVEQFRVRL